MLVDGCSGARFARPRRKAVNLDSVARLAGQFGTNVLGVEFYNQLFAFNNPGKAAAVVVILLIAVIPVVFYQIRSYRQQEALR